MHLDWSSLQSWEYKTEVEIKSWCHHPLCPEGRSQGPRKWRRALQGAGAAEGRSWEGAESERRESGENPVAETQEKTISRRESKHRWVALRGGRLWGCSALTSCARPASPCSVPTGSQGSLWKEQAGTHQPRELDLHCVRVIIYWAPTGMRCCDRVLFKICHSILSICEYPQSC